MVSDSAAPVVYIDGESQSDPIVGTGSSPALSDSEGSSPDGSSTDLKKDLRQCLDCVQSLGTFASFRTLEDFIDPAIHVDGEPISLPLCENDAQRIIRASHKAAFGKGSETIIDMSVRNTWEMNRGDFQLKNPDWKNYMHDILEKVSEELGISSRPAAIRAELYKMLLYEKGAMFKPHTDTEKIPDMFGTLVVCLLSKHTGGAVKVKHGKQSKIFRTETAAQSYVCWYSDVKHEVTEVTSGYRWVLTYNLANLTATEDLSANFICYDSRLLTTVLRKWRKEIAQDQSRKHELIYMLEHKYTDASLKLNTLKGADLLKAKLVKKVCALAGFGFYLASLERMVLGCPEESYNSRRYGYRRYGYDDYDDCPSGKFHVIEEEIDRSLKLKRVLDPDGNEIGKDYKIKEEYIVQEQPFEDRDPDEEDYMGFTGNESASATHWYRNTVIVLTPPEANMAFLLRPFRRREEWDFFSGDRDVQLYRAMQTLMQQFTENPKNSNASNDLFRVCQFVMGERRKAEECLPSTLCGLVVKASALLRKPDLVRQALLRAEKLPIDAFSYMGTLILLVGFPSLHPVLTLAVDRIKTIDEMYRAMKGIVEHSNNRERQIDWTSDLGHWAVAKLHDIMGRAKSFGARDGEALVGIISWRKENRQIFKNAISCVKDHIGCTPFVMTFLRFFGGAKQEEMPQATSTTFKELLASMVATLNLHHQPEGETFHNANSGRHLSAIHGQECKTTEMRRAPVDGHHIAELLSVCLSLNLIDELGDLLESLISEAARTDSRDYQSMLLPFLKRTKDVLKLHKIPLTHVLFQRLYQSILSSYVTRCVGRNSAEAVDWARPNVACSCVDCTELNEFLSDPHETVAHFPVSVWRRAHLHQKLDFSDSNCSHITDRNGYSETLVVTKRPTAAHLAEKEWKQRAEEARKWMAAFGKRDLQQLLGENYECITALRTARSLPGTGRPAMLTKSLVNRGVKRKAEQEVIDLTGDDF